MNLQNPAAHAEHYIPVHVRYLHIVQHVLHTVPGDRQRLDDSDERPLLSHEKQFERFSRPVFAILNTGPCTAVSSFRDTQMLGSSR